MKHTPGPWQIKRTLEEERFTIWDKEHRLLAVAYNQDLDHKGPDGCVRAIAAAPELKELLCEALWYVDEFAGMWMHDYADKLSDRICACLSKIEGRDDA